MAAISVEEFLNNVLHRVHGLETIIVSDPYGVPLVTVGKDIAAEESSASVFSFTTEQTSKLSMGACHSLTTFFRDQIFVYVNSTPLVLIAIGKPDANVGLFLSMSFDISAVLDPLRNSIASNF
mmetsp:Transcript_36759/g.59400  ORF Transcript_36759/g.59400 Transcript_36759/m.59400 type:complete len:123 (-) Transcript_36759:18-386(-)